MGLLPKDFFDADGGKWMLPARNYRKLVEPVDNDNADHKRLGFDEIRGRYWEDNNRSSQYVYIEELEQAADSRAAKA